MTSSSVCTNCGATINPATDPSFCPVCGSGDRHIIVRDTAELKIRERVDRTARARFAEAWFDDAKREALPTTADDLHARRREIIFGVHCLEGYLVEWTADLLSSRFTDAALVDALQEYFSRSDLGDARNRATAALAHVEEARRLIDSEHIAEGLAHLEEIREGLQAISQLRRQNLIGLFSELPRQLYKNGYVPKCLGKYSKDHRQDFARLIDYRNDITHANVSRPDVLSSEPEASRPAGTPTAKLSALPPGWAIGVVAERIQQLHRETGTAPPEWATH
jgi:hypothetical protein